MIKKKSVKRKEVFLASIDVGYLNGMSKDITKVYYKNEYLEVVEVFDEYSLIKVDREARVGECVVITGDNNSLDRYLDNLSVARFNVFGNIPVSYKVGEKVKMPIY